MMQHIDTVATTILLSLLMAGQAVGQVFSSSTPNGATLSYKVTSTNTCEVIACTALRDGKADIPSSVTNANTTYGVTAIAQEAFKGLSELEQLSIPASVLKIGAKAFAECRNLNSVTLGKPSSTRTLGIEAFKNCSALKGVVLYGKVGDRAFQGCTALEKVNISSQYVELGNEAFSGCSALSAVSFYKSLKEIKIGNLCFANCTALQTITFPKLKGHSKAVKLPCLGKELFAGCTNLRIVWFTNKNRYCIKGDEFHEFQGHVITAAQNSFIDHAWQEALPPGRLHLWINAQVSAGSNGSVKAYICGLEIQNNNAGKGLEITCIATPATGYKVKSWSVDGSPLPAATGTTFQRTPQSDVQIAVEFEERKQANTYQVSFDAQGGIPAPAPVNVLHGEKAPEPSPQPARKGYTFLGWHLGGVKYDFNLPVTEPLLLVAQWKPNTYQVSFDAQGGTPAPIPVNVLHGEKVPEPSPQPARKGYTFLGWHLGGVKYDFNLPVTEPLLLVARWQANTYQVSFDAQGGTPAPTPVNVLHGEKAPEPSPQPARQGYTFLGWHLGGVKYDFNLPVTEPLLLVARWQANTYQVSFDAQGGTPAPAPVSVLHGEKAPEPTPQPARKGYTFLGWHLGGVKYDFNLPVTEPLLLVAQWKPNTYQVSFDAQGGAPAPAPVNVLHGEKAPEPSPQPARQGYTFLGWHLGGIKYDFNLPVTEPLLLVARWQANTYQVSFDAQGGTPAPTPVNVLHGEKAPEPSPQPARQGYTFLGWHLGGVKYDFNLPVTEPLLLVARWQANTYQVSFDAQGGTPAPAPVNVLHGEKAPEPSPQPARQGYTFLGWHLGGIKYDFDLPVTEPLLLVAQWKPNTYQVSFDAQGGIPAPAPVNVLHGEKAPEPSPQPARQGYTFLGWHLGGVKYDFNLPVTEPLLLVARWQPNTYQVSFDAQGGTPAPTPVNVLHGEKAPEPSPQPARQGYTFLGWHLGGVKYDFDLPVTEPLLLVAQWKANTYQVSFDAQGGTPAPAPVSVLHGEKAPEPSPQPARKGYTFLGWHLGSVKYDFDLPVTEPLLLVAQWQAVAVVSPTTLEDVRITDSDRSHIKLINCQSTQHWQLLTVTGVVAMEGDNPEANTICIPTGSLAPGVYLILLRSNHALRSIKYAIQHP